MVTEPRGVRVRRAWRVAPWWQKALATVLGATLAVGALGALAAFAGTPPGRNDAGPEHAPDEARADASSRGVTADAIRVAFPYADLGRLGAAFGLSSTEETDQRKYITHFVDEVNEQGGINGRRIEPVLSAFDPRSEADMRAKCLQWTEDRAVFAVVDIGTFLGDPQLCVTGPNSKHRTPMITSWSTVRDFANQAAPYLWSTGADQALVVENLVPWGTGQGLLVPDSKVAVVATNRGVDDQAVSYLERALGAANVRPVTVERLEGDPEQSSVILSQTRATVQKLKDAGVDVVVPLMQFNTFLAFVQASRQQQYTPKLLLSDYEQSVRNSLGLAELLVPSQLSGQRGTTVETLGSEDDDRPVQGYRPGAKSCWQSWRAKNAKPEYIEAQGPIAAWCQNIRLFATAARVAGRDLTRRSFTDAMARLSDYEGVVVERLDFAPGKFFGADTYRTVRVFKNGKTAETNGCPLKRDGGFHGSCWQLVPPLEPRPMEGLP